MWQGAAGAVLHSQSWQAWQDLALAAQQLLAVQGYCGVSTARTRHRLWQSWLLYFKSLVQLSLMQHGLWVSKRLLLFLLTARFCLAHPLGAQQVCPLAADSTRELQRAPSVFYWDVNLKQVLHQWCLIKKKLHTESPVLMALSQCQKSI